MVAGEDGGLLLVGTICRCCGRSRVAVHGGGTSVEEAHRGAEVGGWNGNGEWRLAKGRSYIGQPDNEVPF